MNFFRSIPEDERVQMRGAQEVNHVEGPPPPPRAAFRDPPATADPGESSAQSPAQKKDLLDWRLKMCGILVAFICVLLVLAALQQGASMYVGSSQPPAPLPLRLEQVMVHLGANPNTDLTISWAVPASPKLPSAAAAMAGSILAFGLTPLLLTYSSPVTCLQYSAPTFSSFGNYTSPLLCSGALSVAPSQQGTRLFYKIGDGVNGFYTGSTATAPAQGRPGARLAVLGDLGVERDSAATLARIAASGPFAATLFLGDLSYADGNQTVWDVWGRLYSPLGSGTPTYFLPGSTAPCDYRRPPYCNYTFQAYMSRTHSPSVSGSLPSPDSLFYSFNLGLMHIVMLQGYCPSMKNVLQQPCLAEGSAQLLWLKGDLARVDRGVTPWVVVGFHQPFVNSNMAHSMATEGAPMQAAIEDTLFHGGVDLVLSGHVHACVPPPKPRLAYFIFFRVTCHHKCVCLFLRVTCPC